MENNSGLPHDDCGIRWSYREAFTVETLFLEIIFHVFMDDSIFLAFFMATGPATAPLTKMGQIIFGAGLAILTIVIQTYTGFLGGIKYSHW